MASAFICLDLFVCFVDSEKKQVQLITTLDNSEVDLLTLEYTKVLLLPINQFIVNLK